jgi:hypothetical protein
MLNPDDRNPLNPTSEPSLDELKKLAEWPAIEKYIDGRLRGSGSRIRQLEQQLTEHPDVGAMQAELEALRSERDAHEKQLNAENERLFAALPPKAQSIVPDGLTPQQKNDLLKRLEANTVDRKIPVLGAGGVRMLDTPDAAALAADRARYVGHKFLFGDKTKSRGGR